MFRVASRSTSKRAFATEYVRSAALHHASIVSLTRSIQIRSGPTGALFKPDTFITGDGGAGNNWAKGCSSSLLLFFSTHSHDTGLMTVQSTLMVGIENFQSVYYILLSPLRC